jgi:hypothetical protein
MLLITIIRGNKMQHNCTLKLKTFLFFSFLFFLLIAYSLPLNATIRYVSKTGSSVPPYITWETAADSIQKCINICVFGDTIYVANGIYQEQVVMIAGLSLIGAGMDSCVIDSRNIVSAWDDIAIEVTDSCLLKGFRLIVANNFDEGIGMGIAGSGSCNCLVTLNKVTNASNAIFLDATFYGLTDITVYKNICENIGIGVNLFNSNAIVRNNFIFVPNIIGGKGIYLGAFGPSYTPLVDSNYIEITPGGVGIQKNIDSSPTIKNNVIKLKNGGRGIFSNVGGTSKIFNNLIIAEQSGYQGIDKVSNVEVINNHIRGHLSSYGILAGPNDIIKNNVVTEANTGIESSGIQNLPYLQYNDSWNNGINYAAFAPDTTNLSVDPMIVNDDRTQGKLDFHLQKYSPLIDSGDPNIQDKDGSKSDIGLYGGPYGESYIYVDLPPRTPVNLTANVDTLIKLNWNKNTEADFSYYKVYRDTTFNFSVDSTTLIALVTDTFYYQTFPSNVETLYYKLTAVDKQGNESNPSDQVYVKLVSVKNEWIPVNNYILYQNYPNPFNPSTKIGYKLKERGYVKLYVYDIKGELVSVLVNEVQEAGYYEVEFNAAVSHSGESPNGGRNLASGVYIYQIFVKGENNIPVFSDIKKMLLVK